MTRLLFNQSRKRYTVQGIRRRMELGRGARNVTSYSKPPYTFIIIIVTILSSHVFHCFGIVGASKANRTSQPNCSRACVVQDCNSLGIRYGKYCGVGWTGCPGEEPCDDLDACCKLHDECVEKKGMMNVKCHEKFKKCIKKVQKSGKPGFSEQCSYDVAVPTMTQGMDMAIMFSQFNSPSHEL